jgi:hypothetical protein
MATSQSLLPDQAAMSLAEILRTNPSFRLWASRHFSAAMCPAACGGPLWARGRICDTPHISGHAQHKICIVRSPFSVLSTYRSSVSFPTASQDNKQGALCQRFSHSYACSLCGTKIAKKTQAAAEADALLKETYGRLTDFGGHKVSLCGQTPIGHTPARPVRVLGFEPRTYGLKGRCSTG